MISPSFQAQLRAAIPDGPDAPTLPSPASLAAASASLPRRPPSHGTGGCTGASAKGEGNDDDGGTYLAPLGTEATLTHILTDIVPALNGQARSGRYYGFVTGGTLPAAEAADTIVSALDQNVQVHLPGQTVATEVESVALGMLADVLGLEDGSGSESEEVWKGKTFTTGATATFGIFARALEAKPEFAKIRQMASGLELADSITVDGHKLLNVPYDCGMFFCRSLPTQTAVFTNPNAAYLSSAGASTIPSPLNIGLENSRRFRALPAYAVLRSEGRSGLAAILGRMVLLARKLAVWIRASEAYELLPEGEWDIEEATHMVVLFRARDEGLNEELVGRINGTREVYVSGTSWKEKKAVRVAVGSWRVDVERDFEVVTRVLGDIAKAWARG
ncbi:pyridoxal-dependent decarboxylase [Colletotrichum acutatum]